MTPDEYISAVARLIHDSAVRGVIARLADGPSGRAPRPRALDLAAWYGTLDSRDRTRVCHIVETAVHSALFSMLAACDGVTKLSDADGRLELSWISADGARTILNDESAEYLHDQYQAIVQRSVFGNENP